MNHAQVLAERLRAMADELLVPLLCTSPGYGAFGYKHCAACCYGNGYVIACSEDEAIVAAADALQRAALVVLRGESPEARIERRGSE